MSVWIIADTHWGHKNIIHLCDRPEDHEEQTIENWGSMVSEDDTVIHLGDVAFKNREDVKDIIAGLPGRKILVKGNHDSHGNAKYLSMGFEVVSRTPIVIEETDKYVLVGSHRPLKPNELECFDKEGKKTINIHGHIHNTVSTIFTPPVYVNTCVEVTEYKPVRLEDILCYLEGLEAAELKVEGK